MLNFTGGYPMMGMPSMMGMPMSNNFGAPRMGSVPQMYLNKYGCADCFRDRPYLREYPKQMYPDPPIHYEPSFFRRLFMNIFGS